VIRRAKSWILHRFFGGESLIAFGAGSGTAEAELETSPKERALSVPSALDNGQRSPRKLLRALIARLLGRKP
jgi:hypothetical protein